MSGYKPKRPETGLRKRGSHLRPMLTRKPSVLLAIREQHGSTLLAAINGAVNSEEYLKLEAWNEH
jgi:hypothetical protein